MDKSMNINNYQELKDRHLLRIETVLKSRLIRQMFSRPLFVSDLLSESIVKILKHYFTNEVMSIKTDDVFRIDMSKFSVKSLQNNLACIGMDFIGGQSTVYSIIDNAYDSNQITSNQKSRAKQKTENIIKDSDFLESYSYANELQEKFLAKIENFRVEE